MQLKKQIKITITDISTHCEIKGVEKADVIATLAMAVDDICKQNAISTETIIAAILLANKLKAQHQV